MSGVRGVLEALFTRECSSRLKMLCSGLLVTSLYLPFSFPCQSS